MIERSLEMFQSELIKTKNFSETLKKENQQYKVFTLFFFEIISLFFLLKTRMHFNQ